MEKLNLKREMYFSILMDRKSQGPVMVASPSGGTSIEDVAEQTPELIFKEEIDIQTGPTRKQLEGLAKNMGLEGSTITQGADVLSNLYDTFIGVDATLIEINPLGETAEGVGTWCHIE